MNLIYLTFLLGDTQFILGGLFFCFTHSILSCLMFYLVDCVQRRYHTRSVLELSGILHTTPNLGICIFIMCIFFFGLPGTLKFTSEFLIFSNLIELDNFNFFILIICSNFFGIIGFSKLWFNCLFGMNPKTFRYLPVDLNMKELLIINICNFFLIFPNIFFFIL
jgi:NADH:ubiquinone oxidoreductase subunit 4 (subunit M)